MGIRDVVKDTDINFGLSNGIRMKIISVTIEILGAHVTNGPHIGDYALISRI